MAVAGQAQLDSVRATLHSPDVTIVATRSGLKVAYWWILAIAGVALVALIPPHFEFSTSALITAAVVGVFLVWTERPNAGFGVSYAPLGAVLTAVAATISWWVLPIGIVAFAAAHWRLHEAGRPLSAFINALTGQLGIATLAIYAMVSLYGGMTWVAHLAPTPLSPVIYFVGIVAVGMTWHIVNNSLALLGYTIGGQPSSLVRYWRSGIVASLWAYLLVAMYAFGGLLGATVFYVVVAHTRMFDRIVKAAEARDEQDFLGSQLREMIRELLALQAQSAEFTADVRYISMQLARKCGMTKQQCENVALAAEFHEIGKCKLSPAVRNGVDLTPAQKLERLRFPQLGAKLLRKAPKLISEEVCYAVEHQCEAFDGSGYPHGMRASNIPAGARIVAIVRDYVAMLTGYDGAEQRPKQQALATLRERAGTQYDPALVDLLCVEVA